MFPKLRDKSWALTIDNIIGKIINNNDDNFVWIGPKHETIA